MSAQDDAFKEGMRYRRDNVTESELIFELGKRSLSESVYNGSVVDGWKFMDRLILGLDMLDGRA